MNEPTADVARARRRSPPVAELGLPPRVARDLRRALDENRARCDARTRRDADPVGLVHAYADPLERELVGLLAASFAFGNVKALRAKIAIVLAALGPDLLATAGKPGLLARRLATFRHRVYTGPDVVALLVGARRVQRRFGSLGKAFEASFTGGATFDDACDAFVAAIRAAGRLDARTSYGAKHILVGPRGKSAAKRLMLFLRWMIRADDGVDFGLWSIAPAQLVIPLDVHIHKIARNIGLTDRPTASWTAAREITGQLARLDPSDPVKYDFSLCHLGMVQRCPSKRDAVKCEGCGIRPVCRHWRRPV